MLCQCIPIVSNVNVLPKIVGDSGFILEKRDSIMLIDFEPGDYVTNYSKLELIARNRIKNNFTIEHKKC